MIPDTLYAAAFAFRQTKLWQQLYDSQIFALKHSDGSIGYCCVMGMMGEHLALAVYPGEEGLAAYRSMGTDRSALNDFADQEISFSQDCVMCSFENKDDLRPKDIAGARLYCKANGIALRGKNAYPQFQRFRPRYYPWYLEEEKDQTHLLEGLQACLEVAKKLADADPEALGFTEGEPFGRAIPLLKKRGRGWTWEAHTLPEPTPVTYPTAEIHDEIRLERIKTASHGAESRIASAAARGKPSAAAINQPKGKPSKRRKHNQGSEAWVCDVVMYPSAMRQSDDPSPDDDDTAEPLKAPFFPYMLMLIDSRAGAPLHIAITEHTGAYAEHFGEAILKLMEERGAPTHLYVQNDRAFALVKGIAEQLNIPLTQEESLPVLEEALEDFYEHNIEQPFGDVEGSDTAAFLEQLADPAHLAVLPNDILTQIAGAVGQIHPKALPEGLLANIAAELGKRRLKP